MRKQRHQFHRLILVLFMILLALPSYAQEQRPLKEDALENVVSFIRLVGYVQYFYAGDAASGNDWDAFLAQHIEEVESAETEEALTELLIELFTPYVPEFRVVAADDFSDQPILQYAAPPDAESVTAWLRIGFGSEAQGRLVAGQRIQLPIGSLRTQFEHPTFFQYLETPILITIPDPNEPFAVQLTDDLVALFPLSVYSDELGTLPRIPPPSPAFERQPTARAMRLAVVGEAWNLFQHLYPYWETLSVDWEKVLRDTLVEAASGDDEAFLAALQQMTAHLGDAHTVTTRGQFTTEKAYAFPFTWDVIEGQLVVTTLLDNEVALQPGDIITEIDGVAASAVIEQELSRVSGVGQYRFYAALLNLLTGTRDSAAALTVQSPQAETSRQVSVTRDFRTGSQRQFYWREYRPEAAVTDLQDGVWYVDLTRISTDDLTRSMRRLIEARAIVFDMRGYPASPAPSTLLSHLTDQPLSIPPSYVPLFTFPDHTDYTLVDVTQDAEPLLPRLDAPTVWLINGNGTYSYPETILAVVEGYRLGTLVGQSTAGASGNRVMVSLMDGYRTSWTGLYVTNFDGSPLFGVGVRPDVEVERTIDGVVRQEDELLNQAVETALELLAD